LAPPLLFLWRRKVDDVKLTGTQLHLIMLAAAPIPLEKRSIFLERVAGHLGRIGYLRVRDDDVARAVTTALKGLVHSEAA
jgi:hypothetical protein